MSDYGSEVRDLISAESERTSDPVDDSVEQRKTVTEVVFHLLKSSLGIIPVETKENEVKAVITITSCVLRWWLVSCVKIHQRWEIN
jgi:hypothetical protein